MKKFTGVLNQIRNGFINVIRSVFDSLKSRILVRRTTGLSKEKIEELKIEDDNQGNFKEIKMGSREFLVECVSCKNVHELSAICISCGKPVCTNITYCRKTRYDEQLDDKVVYCSICAV